MSHFLTLVFVPPAIAWQGKQAIQREVQRLMAPYNRYPGPDDSNPVGTWDGWKIGGRWAGAVQGTANTRKHIHTTNEINEASLEMNSCLVQDLPYELIPFAVVTPDGVWHSEGEMQEFGLSTNHDPYWEDKYDALREQYTDYLAIALDCHV